MAKRGGSECRTLCDMQDTVRIVGHCEDCRTL